MQWDNPEPSAPRIEIGRKLICIIQASSTARFLLTVYLTMWENITLTFQSNDAARYIAKFQCFLTVNYCCKVLQRRCLRCSWCTSGNYFPNWNIELPYRYFYEYLKHCIHKSNFYVHCTQAWNLYTHKLSAN